MLLYYFFSKLLNLSKLLRVVQKNKSPDFLRRENTQIKIVCYEKKKFGMPNWQIYIYGNLVSRFLCYNNNKKSDVVIFFQIT